MFFFIGGVQTKTKVLDDAARSCPNCGRVAVRYQRTDHYLSVFFIPLFPVKRGIPHHACRNCGAVFDEQGTGRDRIYGERGRACRRCGKLSFDAEFSHCPYCGNPLDR